MNTRVYRVDALAVADADSSVPGPASLLLTTHSAGLSLLACDRTDAVLAHPASANATVISRQGSVLIPGLVNAHSHLDLTHLGPFPHDPARHNFVHWVERIRAGRETEPEAIANSVRRGVELALAGGTVAVGDIAGAPAGRPSLVPWRTLRGSPLMGVSFLEFFAIGTFESRSRAATSETLDSARETDGSVRLGLQPHAPNTVSLPSYAWAIEQAASRGLLLSTHLAETPEEREFVGAATGPQRQLLERLGAWSDDLLADFGLGRHPVAHLAPALRQAADAGRPMLVAHVNDADDAAIDTLAGTGTSVAYCPRASAYFGAPAVFGPHRYRDMLAAGVNVCFGTDSLVNLPEHAADIAGGGICILDELRMLARRDRTDPRTLLAMATVSGAKALGLDPDGFRFRIGQHLPAQGVPLAGIVGVPIDTPSRNSWSSPHELVAGSTGPVELLSNRISSDGIVLALDAKGRG